MLEMTILSQTQYNGGVIIAGKLTNIGASIKLDGEAEFKKALVDINAGLRMNASELVLTSEKYSENSKSVEALTEKGKILQSQISSQSQKVNELNAMLEKSKVQHGETSKQTLNYQTQVNRAQTELLKMNKSLKENETALGVSKKALVENDKAVKASTTSVSSLKDVVTSLTSAMGINVPPAMQGMVNSLDKVNASGALLVGVLAGIVTSLVKVTIETAKTADELLTLSSTTGMTTDAIQEIKYASDFLDVSFETINGSMTKLIKSMDGAKTGSKAQSEAFKELKISILDNNKNLKDSNVVFYDVIDALGKVKNETERDALSMQLFGKSARELNPLIEEGSQRLKELGIEAHEMGYILDSESLQQFGALEDAMMKMERQGTALKNNFAEALLPMITSLFDVLSSIPVPVLQTLITVITTIVGSVLMIKTVMSGLNLIDFLLSLNPVALKTLAIILAIAGAIAGVLYLVALLKGQGEDAKFIFGGGGKSFGVDTSQIPRYAKGTKYHSGGLAVVGENGPEIVELSRGAKVYPNGITPPQENTSGDNYYITVDASNVKEFNDIIVLAKKAKQERRAK